MPNSLRERIKLNYYNIKNNKFSFALQNGHYVTKEGDSWEVITRKPLYFIVKDIERYEKYYKVKINDIVIDAGANEGALSVVYSQKIGNRGKVFAFEPDSINVEMLKSNLSLNKKYSNIDLVEMGLWNKKDIIDFFEAGSVGSSVFYEDKKSKKVAIQTISIDNFMSLQKINHLNFVKMDIEGAEIEALEGAIKSIDKYKPDFAIASYHIINNKPTYIAVEDFFRKIDYPYKTEFFKDGEIITYAGKSIK